MAKNVPKDVVESIARVCHEVNREYCMGLGDYTQPMWDAAPQWQKDSARKGVELHLHNPESSARDSHESWMKQKLAEGWVYGEEKNPEAKTHPCIVPFDELPVTQRLKDYVFMGIVKAIAREMARPSVASRA
jgi:hypothetical protein